MSMLVMEAESVYSKGVNASDGVCLELRCQCYWWSLFTVKVSMLLMESVYSKGVNAIDGVCLQ